jgi:tetratricopeptide (TPR) repeat protein
MIVMMSRMLGATILVFALFLAGCKSVQTTSAILHNQSGRYDLAIKTANEALAKNPRDAEAEFQLGVAYSYLDSVGLAYKHFKKTAEIDPNREQDVQNNIQSNFARHYNAALNSIKDENYAGAATELERAVQADPMDEKGHFQLGTVYTRLGDASADSSAERTEYYLNAINHFDNVLNLAKPSEKHYADALNYAGQVLAKSGKIDEAASRFNRLVEEDPTNYRMIEKMGYDLVDQQNWKGAALFLDLAAQARAKIGVEDFTLYYNLGVARFNLGKDGQDPASLAKAVEYYKKALVLNPDEPQTVRNVVVTYVFAENWREVAEWGERYVAVSPDDADGWRMLVRAYNEIGDKEKARRCELRWDELRKRGSGSE